MKSPDELSSRAADLRAHADWRRCSAADCARLLILAECYEALALALQGSGEDCWGRALNAIHHARIAPEIGLRREWLDLADLWAELAEPRNPPLAAE